MRRWPFPKPPAVEPSEVQVAEFRDLCERAAKSLRDAGILRVPYADASVPLFKKNPRFERALESFRVYVEVLEESVNAGDAGSKKFLWRMVTRLGLVPTSDLLNHIDDDNVVEIYTLEHWQVFRNLRFFDYVSFTVEEVANLNWQVDTRRESRIELKLLEIGIRLKFGLMRATADVSGIAEHTFKELRGEGWTTAIQLLRISPLRKGNSITACVVTNRARVIDRGSSGHAQEGL